MFLSLETLTSIISSHSYLVSSHHIATSFHHIAYDYPRADWDGLCDHLRDVPWEDIFKLGVSAAHEFCEGPSWK